MILTGPLKEQFETDREYIRGNLLIVDLISPLFLFVDTIKSTFFTTKRSKKPTTYEGNLTNKLASAKLLTTSRPPREVPRNDGNFKWTLIAIIIAVVVPVLFFAVLVAVLCFLSKRKKNK